VAIQRRTTPNDAVRMYARFMLSQIEEKADADGLCMIGPIVHGLEHMVRDALESLSDRKGKLLVVLDTPGGVVEVVERVVRVMRTLYADVTFVIPDRALSAGTVLALSGDSIQMSYHSCLGPIDPQVERDGKLVPALSYLHKFEELSEKSRDGELTTAEVVLLSKLDLAELHRFELARDFSLKLLRSWLPRWKFSDWNHTEERGLPVTQEMRQERAEEIARILNDHRRWNSHGRGIPRDTLEQDVGIRIDHLENDADFHNKAEDYFYLIREFMRTSGLQNFVHSREYF